VSDPNGNNVAAIDCGTNSTRLLIADAAGRTIERHTTITKLGEGVDATNRLDPSAIRRVTDTLGDYRRRIEHHDVTKIRMIATSAARDATNRAAFFDAATKALANRVSPELLTGEEEGRLSFQGATAGLDPNPRGPHLVVDIGGGSTELVVGEPGQAPIAVTSIDFGCVRVMERFLATDPPDPGELSDALSVLRVHLDDVARTAPATKEAATIVGVAGTVTTLAAIDQGLHTYDPERVHHSVLTRRAAEDAFRTLATEPRAERAANPGLEPARVDVIVGGALILVGILRYFGADELLVSESDILDGLIATLLGERPSSSPT
jgi:exopolyphosphatase/guanosine-5'-triphosphate,3'-diphosphate pyrophosphatase